MSLHQSYISKSIDLNIIGTANVVKVCKKFNIKLIYFSSGYVYSGVKGNYLENDSVKPFNNYGLSKLGGECAVSMYKNSLILRITMIEKPFPYKKAFFDLLEQKVAADPPDYDWVTRLYEEIRGKLLILFRYLKYNIIYNK